MLPCTSGGQKEFEDGEELRRDGVRLLLGWAPAVGGEGSDSIKESEAWGGVEAEEDAVKLIAWDCGLEAVDVGGNAQGGKAPQGFGLLPQRV